MFDFHIQVALNTAQSAWGDSLSGLLPAEAIRLARAAGLKGVGLVVRSDTTLLAETLHALVPVVRRCSLYAGLEAFAGVMLADIPPALIPDAVAECRALGAQIVIGHGEGIPRTALERVDTGTNLAYILAGVDIVAHAGILTDEDASLAHERGVHVALSTASQHALANGHLARMAMHYEVPLLLNSNAAAPSDFASPEDTATLRRLTALGAGLHAEQIAGMSRTARAFVQRLLC